VRIKFNEKSHTYTHVDTKERFISVTTLLGKYKKPFDKELHARRVSDREGVPIDMVLEMWESEKNKACDRGNKIHKLLEDYIEYGEMDDNHNWLYKTYDKSVEWYVDKFDKILSENVVYNEEFKVAGMADLIYEHKNGEFTVGDFKTNKKFRFSSPFGERLLAPVDHLHNCEFNIYALQLSMYAYLYEQMTGKKCRKCVIFYLKDDKFKPYHVNYLKSDIKAILKQSLINT
tara:strand:- start:48 stop:740 length:693 start_codon:yes stop_codon:yes gene_type:complete